MVSRNLSLLTPEELSLNAEIGRFLRFMVEHHPDIVGEVEKGWDLVMISVASWFINISSTNSTQYYKEVDNYV